VTDRQRLQHRGAAQIDGAVLEPQRFIDGDVLVDRERRRGSVVEDLELGHRQLDLAGCEVRVDVLRVSPDDRVHHRSQVVEIELSEVKGRAVVLFNISSDGTVQLLYPKGADTPSSVSASMRVSLRVGEPFGAEQIIAVTSQQRMIDLEDILLQFNRRRASGQIVKSLARYVPADARIGSVGFFTAP